MDPSALYQLTSQIPAGKVTTYQLLVTALGFPRHARQAGQILKRNPTPVTVPCHRVIASNGKLSGYVGEMNSSKKIDLLVAEGVTPIAKGYLTRGEMREYVWTPPSAESQKN